MEALSAPVKRQYWSPARTEATLKYHNDDDLLVYSPSDVTRLKGCARANALEIDVAMGRREAPPRPPSDVYARAGLRFEAEVLQRLIDKYGSDEVVIIDRPGPYVEDIKLAAKESKEAMAAGVAVVHQATLWDDIDKQTSFLGYADFLMRQPDGTYRVVDTKIAKDIKDKYLIQVGLYARTLERMTGVSAIDPAIHLGTNEIKEIPLEKALDSALNVEAQFLDALAPRRLISIEPPEGRVCEECKYCRWSPQCRDEWVASDALTLIAGVGPKAMVDYRNLGIRTGTELGHQDESAAPEDVPPNTWRRHVLQARLQSQAKKSNEIPYVISEREYLANLRPPTAGDVYFDLEGYAISPYSLEYLFGLWDGTDFTSFWAHSKEEEKRSLESFVDYVSQRMQIYPDMRIYYFNHYEPSALRRLAAEHGIHQELINQWCNNVLVDLRPFVVRCLMAGLEGYGLKELERLYGFARAAELKTAAGSIELYDEWLYSPDHPQRLLDLISAYNLEDLHSTQALHVWLTTR